MEHDRIKPYESIYFRCRKQAALYNDKLNSSEGAAELLGCSVSSVAGYELGTTKCVPADVVVLMADLYNAPELLNYYCKNDCPIGCRKDIPTDIEPLENITLKLLDVLSPDKLQQRMNRLTQIAVDGKVSADEHDSMTEIVSYLNEVKKLVETLLLFDEKRNSARESLIQEG